MEIVNSIGQYKKENNMTILQPNRWDEVLSVCIDKGKKHDLESEFIAKLFKTIHQESINKQTVIMNE
jgi:chorismate mutase